MANTPTPHSLASAPQSGLEAEIQLRLLRQGAHELRNQLAVSLLELGKIADPAARKIEDDIRRTSDTIYRLALLARMAARADLPHQDLDLVQLARDAIGQVRQVIPDQRRQIEFNARGTFAMHANRPSVAEAVRGLVDNAIRHTPSRTRIVVTVGADPAIVVEDDGPGYSERDLPRLGEPFTTGGSANAGAGLGLAIARQLALSQGGEMVLARSSLGGAKTSLHLPAAACARHRHELA